jgi:hydrogenase expression/formation protein HypD
VKYIDEYNDEADARALVHSIRHRITRPWVIMEICGGQTHTIIRSGIDTLLSPGISLVHGPGCPVCVTSLELVDRAVSIAKRPNVILASFGDMLRVPGSGEDLLSVRAQGGDVRMVYSPLEAVALAEANPGKEVVFFAVGFETTAPANAMALWQARERKLPNFSVLCSHVLVPPAMEAILGSPDCRVQGFLAAGHVCAVMGYKEYEPIAAAHHIPIVVTGFEPIDILKGIDAAVAALEEGRYGVENEYRRAVTRDGNRVAQDLMEKVFEVSDRVWRGIGTIPRSGYRLRPEFSLFDAERRFDVGSISASEYEPCIASRVLRGLATPVECPAFGGECTPERPRGAPMVSSEGACAAYYRYGRKA